jgi:hypothetical protein
MESNLVVQKRAVAHKIPDIKSALQAIELLDRKAVRARVLRAASLPAGGLTQSEAQKNEEDLSTHFELADNVYAKAVVKQPDAVFLWLGVRRARPPAHPLRQQLCRGLAHAEHPRRRTSCLSTVERRRTNSSRGT